MITIYIFSAAIALFFWHCFMSRPTSGLSVALYEMGYRKWPMLVVSMIPVINTVFAILLCIHSYVNIVEIARRVK